MQGAMAGLQCNHPLKAGSATWSDQPAEGILAKHINTEPEVLHQTGLLRCHKTFQLQLET